MSSFRGSLGRGHSTVEHAGTPLPVGPGTGSVYFLLGVTAVRVRGQGAGSGCGEGLVGAREPGCPRRGCPPVHSGPGSPGPSRRDQSSTSSAPARATRHCAAGRERGCARQLDDPARGSRGGGRDAPARRSPPATAGRMVCGFAASTGAVGSSGGPAPGGGFYGKGVSARWDSSTGFFQAPTGAAGNRAWPPVDVGGTAQGAGRRPAAHPFLDKAQASVRAVRRSGDVRSGAGRPFLFRLLCPIFPRARG